MTPVQFDSNHQHPVAGLTVEVKGRVDRRDRPVIRVATVTPTGGSTRMTREHFVAALAVRRRNRGLSQAEVAQDVEVTQQTLSSWETGTTRPGRAGLARWADALGVERYPENVEPVRPACATYRGYQKHRRLGETPCDDCKDANAFYIALYRMARRGSAAVAA